MKFLGKFKKNGGGLGRGVGLGGVGLGGGSGWWGGLRGCERSIKVFVKIKKNWGGGVGGSGGGSGWWGG